MIGFIFIWILMVFRISQTEYGYYEKDHSDKHGEDTWIGAYRWVKFNVIRFIRKKMSILKTDMSFSRFRLKWIKIKIKANENLPIVYVILLVSGFSTAFILSQMIGPASSIFATFVPFFAMSMHAGQRVEGVSYADDYTDNGTSKTLTAIQSAIDDARSTQTEPIIYVGPGTWNGSTAIVFDGATSSWTGIQFIGSGVGKTLINSTVSGSDVIKFTQSGTGVTRTYRVLVQDMTILGTVNSNHGINFDFTWGLTVERVRVRNCTKVGYCGIMYNNCYRTTQIETEVQNCYYGIGTPGSNNLTMIGGSVLSCLDYGIQCLAWSIVVEGVGVAGCLGGGIYSQGGMASLIEGVYFEGNTDYDIYVDGTPDIPVVGEPGLSANNNINNNYHNGWFSGAVHTTNGIRVRNTSQMSITNGTFVNHTGSAILIGYDGGDDNKCYNVMTDNNWTGDIYGAVAQWGWEDATLIETTAHAYYTKIRESKFLGSITDAGHFTETVLRDTRQAKNNAATLLCPGDPVLFDSSDNTGVSVISSSTQDGKISGVVYDGVVDTLKTDVLGGVATIEVDDIWAWWVPFKSGYTKVQIRDDAGNTEHMTMNDVDTSSDEITFTGNLANAHTTANNTRVLLEFDQNDYFTIITKGQVEYLHVDGTKDIAVGSYIGQSSNATVGYKGFDNFIAVALAAYTADNQNGLIAAQVEFKESIKIITQPAFGAGGTVEGPNGWNIGAAGRYVMAFVTIPQGVTEVLGFDIYAVASIAEADKMLLEPRFTAGGDNEPSNTHSQNYTNHQSQSSNFAASDIIWWRVDTGNILDVTAGDAVSYQILYEGVTAPDADSQCWLKTITTYCI